MNHFTIAFFLLILSACQSNNTSNNINFDPHSFSRPDITAVSHLHLELQMDFEQKKLLGKARYTLERKSGNELILDTKGLEIIDIYALDKQFKQTEALHFTFGNPDQLLGKALIIQLKPNTQYIEVKYRTTENATALQWLDKELTTSKKFPFFFTQSQSIYARTWIPCPDGPGMRFTYDATVQVPKGMMVAMSATNSNQLDSNGIYTFKMEIPIPAYLLALAAGDFKFKAISDRCGVYAEDHILEKAIYEFTDIEKMVVAAENLYGEYPWGRYDVLILPPSFPFGGMENPKLTFVTPSVIVGDRSLTSLLAHELAHSWSGNLVTNATWDDFWLNEGFTTYFESRIMESLYGKEYADMISNLGFQDLQKTIEEMGKDNPLTKLKLNLKNQDPEEGLTDIAYEKGKLLLRFLEERIGRNKWDAFLKSYFNHYKFKSNNSEGFLSLLQEQLVPINSGLMDTVKIWIYEPGLPDFRPSYINTKFENVEAGLNQYLSSKNATDLKYQSWSTHEWLHFVRKLPKNATADDCKKWDADLLLTEKKNPEIACAWFNFAIQHGYGPDILPELEAYLRSYGRRKLIAPIYESMVEQNMREEALSIFNKAKGTYHPISIGSIEKILSPKI